MENYNCDLETPKCKVIFSEDEYETGTETDTDSTDSTSSLKEIGEYVGRNNNNNFDKGNKVPIVSSQLNKINTLPRNLVQNGYTSIYNRFSLRQLKKKLKCDTIRTLDERIEIRYDCFINKKTFVRKFSN